MRLVWLIPATYVAGIEGFGIFMPYLAFVCTVAAVARMVQRSRRKAAEARQSLVPAFSELEAAPA